MPSYLSQTGHILTVSGDNTTCGLVYADLIYGRNLVIHAIVSIIYGRIR